MSKLTVSELDRFGMLDASPTDPPLYREVLALFRPPADKPVIAGRKPRKRALAVAKRGD